MSNAENNKMLQLDANRKRESDLGKLRKLLEESQVENEDLMNSLRKKHQDAIIDFQDQLEQAHKKNAKYVYMMICTTIIND
jgi:hypothetical protein